MLFESGDVSVSIELISLVLDLLTYGLVVVAMMVRRCSTYTRTLTESGGRW